MPTAAQSYLCPLVALEPQSRQHLERDIRQLLRAIELVLCERLQCRREPLERIGLAQQPTVEGVTHLVRRLRMNHPNNILERRAVPDRGVDQLTFRG